MKRHKWADLIHEWAEGAEIEYFQEGFNTWLLATSPTFSESTKYRIKPEKKPDVVLFTHTKIDNINFSYPCVVNETSFRRQSNSNMSFTFDGETGKLIKAEVL